MLPECSKHQVLSFAKTLVVNEQKIFCSDQCSPECLMNKLRAYISTGTCVSSFPGPSVWLGLTSREQLMSPEFSMPQVLSFAKTLVVNEQKIFCSDQCSPECLMNKLRAYISTGTCVSSFPGPSVWLGLTSREQLMSSECSNYQIFPLGDFILGRYCFS